MGPSRDVLPVLIPVNSMFQDKYCQEMENKSRTELSCATITPDMHQHDNSSILEWVLASEVTVKFSFKISSSSFKQQHTEYRKGLPVEVCTLNLTLNYVSIVFTVINPQYQFIFCELVFSLLNIAFWILLKWKWHFSICRWHFEWSITS